MNAADILAGGARLVRTRPKAIAIWGALYLLVCIGMLALIEPMFADLMLFQQQAIAARTGGLPPPEPPAGFFPAILALEAVIVVLMVAIFAAAVRATALGGHDRFAFLRVGMDEVRLVGLGLLLLIAGIVVTFAAGVLVGIIAAIASAAAGGSLAVAGGLGFIFSLALMALIVWLQVRISLAGALTVLRGRIVVREAWRLTRGRFWTLFGVYLLVGVAYFALTFALLGIVNPGLLTAYAGGMDPVAMQAALAQQQAMFMNPFSPQMIASWLIGGALMTVGVAFTFGAVATAAIGFDHEQRGD